MFNFQTMNNMINMVNQFKSNPTQMLAKKFNIPSELTDPNQILQHRIDSKQVTQEQVNMVNGLKDNPAFMKLMNM